MNEPTNPSAHPQKPIQSGSHVWATAWHIWPSTARTWWSALIQAQSTKIDRLPVFQSTLLPDKNVFIGQSSPAKPRITFKWHFFKFYILEILAHGNFGMVKVREIMVTVNKKTDINCRSVMGHELQSLAWNSNVLHAHSPLQPPCPYSPSCNNTYRAHHSCIERKSGGAKSSKMDVIYLRPYTWVTDLHLPLIGHQWKSNNFRKWNP